MTHSSFDLFRALLAFLMFVAVTPVWVWFVANHGTGAGVSAETQFLATFALPAALLLYLAGWLQPRRA